MADPRRWPRPAEPPSDDWYTDERSIRETLIGELQRHKRRMKAHPVRVLAVASVLTAVVVMRYATKLPLYTGEVILRVSESSILDNRGSPLPIRDLESHVYNVVLNNRVLKREVIEKHGLYTKTIAVFEPDREAGLEAAVEELREWLNIRVFQNYFVFDRRHETVPRALRLAIEFTDTDPEFAYWMAVTLSNLVVESEHAKRIHEARFFVTTARLALEQLEGQHAARLKRQSELLLEQARASLVHDAEVIAATTVELDSLADKLKEDENRLNIERQRLQQKEFELGLEENRMALLWDLAGETRPKALPPPGPIRLTALAIICFCIFVPACAIGFGTLDSRIHELDDVTRLGMPVVGHISAFEGDGVGSLEARGALKDRGFFGRIGFIKNRRLRDNRIADL